MMYTTEERIQIRTWYYSSDSNNSHRAVRKLFSTHYPHRPIPSLSTIHNIIHEFNKQEKPPRPGQRLAKVSEEMKSQIIRFAEEKPNSSTHEIATVFGISQSTVFKLLKRSKFKVFKFPKHQGLSNGDIEKRTQFCETMMDLINVDGGLLYKILFTDEASFTIDGDVNSHNYRYWSNPNEDEQHLPAKLNVWVGIINSHLLGPFFFDGNLNAPKFINLLQDHVFPALDELDIKSPWFQMDEAPAHCTQTISSMLSNKFSKNWIGRFGPMTWPARSPDLSPSVFFVWDYLKTNVYDEVPIRTIEELRERICAACNTLKYDVFSIHSAIQGFYNRLAYCLEARGDHFENLL